MISVECTTVPVVDELSGETINKPVAAIELERRGFMEWTTEYLGNGRYAVRLAGARAGEDIPQEVVDALNG